jgi:hypothetical protein
LLQRPPNLITPRSIQTDTLYSSAIRKDQLTRLLALIRKRTAIQAAIADSHATLVKAYDSASKDLRRAIKYRRDDIMENLEAVREAAEGEEQENKENEAPSR